MNSQKFAGNVAQEDDVTIVVIRRLPADEAAKVIPSEM